MNISNIDLLPALSAFFPHKTAKKPSIRKTSGAHHDHQGSEFINVEGSVVTTYVFLPG